MAIASNVEAGSIIVRGNEEGYEVDRKQWSAMM